MKILLIAGGWSSEREISLKGAKIIEKTLLEMGHEVEFSTFCRNLTQLLARAESADFAFFDSPRFPG